MLYDLQKVNELKAAREKSEQEKARKSLKNSNTGKNKGLAKDTIKKARNIIKNATPLGLFSLIFQMNPISDWMYGLAFMAAILKDILDLVQITGILYIAVIVITLCCSIFIGFMMLLGSFSHGFGRMHRKIIRSWLVLLGGTTAELIFGINFLPIETLTVLIIYGLMLMERKQAQDIKKNGYAYKDAYAEAA